MYFYLNLLYWWHTCEFFFIFSSLLFLLLIFVTSFSCRYTLVIKCTRVNTSFTFFLIKKKYMDYQTCTFSYLLFGLISVFIRCTEGETATAQNHYPYYILTGTICSANKRQSDWLLKRLCRTIDGREGARGSGETGDGKYGGRKGETNSLFGFAVLTDKFFFCSRTAWECRNLQNYVNWM